MSLGVLVLSRESVSSITHPSISDEGIVVTTAIVKNFITNSPHGRSHTRPAGRPKTMEIAGAVRIRCCSLHLSRYSNYKLHRGLLFNEYLNRITDKCHPPFDWKYSPIMSDRGVISAPGV